MERLRGRYSFCVVAPLYHTDSQRVVLQVPCVCPSQPYTQDNIPGRQIISGHEGTCLRIGHQAARSGHKHERDVRCLRILHTLLAARSLSPTADRIPVVAARRQAFPPLIVLTECSLMSTPMTS